MKFYYQTLSELRIAEARLKLLEDKKALLLSKITKCTSEYKDTPTQCNFSNDKMEDYIIKKDKIEADIEEVAVEVNNLKSCLKKMSDILKNVSGLEEKIFRLYFVEQKTPIQISYIVPCGERTVYRYIKKIKNKLAEKDEKNNV